MKLGKIDRHPTPAPTPSPISAPCAPPFPQPTATSVAKASKADCLVGLSGQIASETASAPGGGATAGWA
ncbi:hypothetical protein [Rhodococcus sp. MTM3W5.2]|uniref:hypothetical protein n=1 Tax=Rhodococcus sp. MTM3W5.2 TaxID=1805827 RepID=UPI0011AE8A04|nr:hypothetical protein [Rhodococcus sp. MTM3W5.2]